MSKRVALLDGPSLVEELVDYLTREERMELFNLRSRAYENRDELAVLKREYDVSRDYARVRDLVDEIERAYVRVKELKDVAVRRKRLTEKVTLKEDLTER